MSKKVYDIFTSLDLEMAQPSKKIIQIGACIGNIRTGEILEKISLFVNPNEELTPVIMDLTKITQEDVDNGSTLEEAYLKLKEMHEKYNSFVNTIVWGGGDSQFLAEQLLQENPNFTGWVFGRRWIDVKTLFVSWRFANGEQMQGGLAKSMTKVGLKFQGQKHNATDDAVNTFYLYRAMLEKLKDKNV